MRRCRPRSLPDDLAWFIESALGFCYRHKVFINRALCDYPGDPKFDQLEHMGLLKFVLELPPFQSIPGFRCSLIAEKGAAGCGDGVAGRIARKVASKVALSC